MKKYYKLQMFFDRLGDGVIIAGFIAIALAISVFII